MSSVFLGREEDGVAVNAVTRRARARDGTNAVARRTSGIFVDMMEAERGDAEDDGSKENGTGPLLSGQVRCHGVGETIRVSCNCRSSSRAMLANGSELVTENTNGRSQRVHVWYRDAYFPIFFKNCRDVGSNLAGPTDML